MSHAAFPGGSSVADPELTSRQQVVFGALVEMHARSGRPVGSEALGEAAGLPWSPASIRADLAELEALGLVARSHASAGRVPTASGYAFHVRHGVRPVVLTPDQVQLIDERLRRSTRDVERLLAEASRLLSELTEQLGLAVAAELEYERLANLELAPLDGRRALLVLGLGVGAVRTLVLELESPLDRGELDEVAGVLRSRLVGRPMAEVRARLGADPEIARQSAVRAVARAAADRWGTGRRASVFSAGAGRIAAQPEFATGDQIGVLLRVIEDGPPLDHLMVDGIEGLSAVRVALDEDRALQGCSLVSYTLPGSTRVAVGVLGPLRMDYARALAMVDAIGQRVSELL